VDHVKISRCFMFTQSVEQACVALAVFQTQVKQNCQGTESILQEVANGTLSKAQTVMGGSAYLPAPVLRRSQQRKLTKQHLRKPAPSTRHATKGSTCRVHSATHSTQGAIMSYMTRVQCRMPSNGALVLTMVADEAGSLLGQPTKLSGAVRSLCWAVDREISTSQ
jgi:hypothetical protein